MDHVIQKTTDSFEKPERRSRPGRPAAFDRDEVVAGAIELFWRNGYDGTPLDAISTELGISRSTLYASFGGKDGLWASANDAYLTNVETVIVEPLLTGAGGLSDIDAFLERVGEVVLSDHFPAGCLVINASADTGDKTILNRYVEMFRRALTTALERAANHGELDPNSIESTAAMLVTHVIGLNIAAKAGLNPDLIQQSIDALRRSLRSPIPKAK